MKTIRVLQLGTEDFSRTYSVSKYADWTYEPDLEEISEKMFDVVILDRVITVDELSWLSKVTRAYGLFITEEVRLAHKTATRWLKISKMGEVLKKEDLRHFISQGIVDYFPGSYGEKMYPGTLSIALGFKGNVYWNGFEGVTLEGEYGRDFSQIVFWRNNIPIEQDQTIEFWLEYEKDPEIELELEITGFAGGSISQVQDRWLFTGKDLEKIIYVENHNPLEFMYVSLKAKGHGRLKIVSLHDRHSRHGKGYFIPGGKRMVSKEREEVFYYFDPGNLKPPLNVYFSGYKKQEGFEGYYMMHGMEHPFLLISDSRLEGGAFYLGSDEYEQMIVSIINKHLKVLGFDNTQLLLSGLSMGTFGAMYYGCHLHPHTILLGKPLANIGDVALNGRINRPGDFSTAMDVLHKNCGSLDRDAAKRLNDRFWHLFDETDWTGTRFAVSYMIEDDYDANAYSHLQGHLKNAGTQIYGKGLHGRHNDDTPGIVNWFVNQYKTILERDF